MGSISQFICFMLLSLVFIAVGAELNPAEHLFGKKFELQDGIELPNGYKHIENIAGGKTSSINKHNYLAALKNGDEFYGNAVILNKEWLVTAAWNIHWSEANTFYVRVGSSFANEGGAVYNVSSYVICPGYDKSWNKDIALLKLKKPLKFSKTVKGIPLASTLPKEHSKAVVAGWGSDKNDTIAGSKKVKEASVPIISWQTCRQYYQSSLPENNFCSFAEGTGPCARDFGGPLVYKKKLIGIYLGAFECAGTKYPPVYANIAGYKKWIENTIKKQSVENSNDDLDELFGDDEEETLSDDTEETEEVEGSDNIVAEN